MSSELYSILFDKYEVSIELFFHIILFLLMFTVLFAEFQTENI
jgi:hypothetical protein